MRHYTPTIPTVTTVQGLYQWITTELNKLARILNDDEAPVGESNPTTDEVGLLVSVNRAGVISSSRVTIGAADSGGVGYRVLRVEN